MPFTRSNPTGRDLDTSFSSSSAIALNNRREGLSPDPDGLFSPRMGRSGRPVDSPVCVLDNAFDSGVVGDSKTSFGAISLSGRTSAFAQVSLHGTNFTTTADAQGNFQFSNVGLNWGRNNFTAVARTQDGGVNNFAFYLEREVADNSGVVTEFNTMMLRAIATTRMAPPIASRAIAMANIAMYDAVNSITKEGSAYAVNYTAPAGASTITAAAQAAYRILSALFPNQRGDFEWVRNQAFAQITDEASRNAGHFVGDVVADQIWALRLNDGSTASVTYTVNPAPGNWQPTPGGSASPALPQWGNVRSFAVGDVTALRPEGPAAYNSPQMQYEMDQVRTIGAANSTVRTADQTTIARFWADGAGTFTPPGHWIQIATQFAQSKQNTMFENVRLFAMLGAGLADAAICCWDTKYTYNQWRPVTALQTGTDVWAADPTWTPLLTTPSFPDYTSGHSTFSGAASTILGRFYGDAQRFTTGTPDTALPAGTTRSFNSFSEAAQEASISRVYGGIHVTSACSTGITMGNNIGNLVVNNFFRDLA